MRAFVRQPLGQPRALAWVPGFLLDDVAEPASDHNLLALVPDLLFLVWLRVVVVPKTEARRLLPAVLLLAAAVAAAVGAVVAVQLNADPIVDGEVVLPRSRWLPAAPPLRLPFTEAVAQ